MAVCPKVCPYLSEYEAHFCGSLFFAILLPSELGRSGVSQTPAIDESRRKRNKHKTTKKESGVSQTPAIDERRAASRIGDFKF